MASVSERGLWDHLRNWGRCYDLNFLGCLPILGEKIGVFSSKTNVMIKFLHN
jgi:hypothetical protein